MKASKASKNNGLPGVDGRALIARAVAAEIKAEAARKRARAAKTKFKAARKLYKQARKAARHARKAAARVFKPQPVKPPKAAKPKAKVQKTGAAVRKIPKVSPEAKPTTPPPQAEPTIERESPSIPAPAADPANY
jgi:hypothetical protein